MKLSVSNIETFSCIDGPGVRTVIFLSGCKLRCLFCHNPEMWKMSKKNISVNDLYKKIINNKEYYIKGGITFSGGEPLLQYKVLIKLLKKLKKSNIHTCIETSGVGLGHYNKILKYIDLVILDIKHIDSDYYYKLTKNKYNEVENFIKSCNKLNKKIWIRQVIIPNINDNKEYILLLKEYLTKINNIEKIELLPYHTMGIEKYNKLNIPYPLKDIKDMDIDKLNKLYKYL